MERAEPRSASRPCWAAGAQRQARGCGRVRSGERLEELGKKANSVRWRATGSEDGWISCRSRTRGRLPRTGRDSWKPDARRTGRRQCGPLNRQAENAAPFATPAGALACRPDATGHRRQSAPACKTTDRLPARARGSRTPNEQGPRMRSGNNRSSTCCPTSWP